MLEASIAFVTHPLDHLGIGRQFGADRNGPVFRVRARIRKRHLDFEVAEIAAAVALRHTQAFRVWMAIVIEPRAIVESEAFHDKSVAVPAPDRVPHPTWIRSGFQLAAVEEDLAIREVGIQNEDEPRSLDDLYHLGAGAIGRCRVARS